MNELTPEVFEAICAEVHNGWWEQSKKAGRHAPNDCPSRPARSGKFAKHCSACHPDMYPYAELSESVRDYDRVTVRAVLDAQARLPPKQEPQPAPELETLARETADNIFAEEAKEYGKDRADIILSALQQAAHVKDAEIARVGHENEALTVALREALTQGKAEITRLAAQCAHLEAENALLLASQPPPPEPETGTATVMPPGSTPCVELAELQSLLAQSSRDYVEQAKRLAELAAENDCLRKALARYNPKETA